MTTVGPTGDAGLEWQVTEEFGQRLGCGLVTAVVLPVWFGVMLLGTSTTGLAGVVGSLFFAAALIGGIAGWRRIRSLPRSVVLEPDGRLRFGSRTGETVRRVAELREVRLGSSLGIKPVRLDFGAAGAVRMSSELDDLDGFLAALTSHNPAVAVVDRRGPG